MPRFPALLFAAVLLGALGLTLWLLGMPVVGSLEYMAQGAWGSKFGLSKVLVAMCPLALCGCGIAIAWRSGLFNIGAEGQFIAGGLGAACIFHVARGAPVPVLLAGAVITGALLGLAVGWLQSARGVPLVISTILVNFIMIQALDGMSAGPLRAADSGLPMTTPLPDALRLTRWDPQTDLHSGMVVAVIACLVAAWFLFSTPYGLGLRLLGQSVGVARAQRLPVSRYQAVAMALSGGLCGLAGGVEYLGPAGYLSSSFSQSWGYLAIPVALLGGLHPLGILASAFIFGSLYAGTDHLARHSTAQTSMVFIIQGIVMLTIVALSAILQRREALRTAA